MRKSKRKYPQQLKIAGTERLDRNVEIEDLAEQLREASELAAAHKQEEASCAAALLDAMQTANMTNYTYEGPDGRLRRVSLRQLSHKVVIADVNSYGEVPKVGGDEARN